MIYKFFVMIDSFVVYKTCSHKEAIEHYLKVLELNPNSRVYLLNVILDSFYD